MTPVFEVWESPGGLVWEGEDQEEALLAALRRRRAGVLIEVAELYDTFGQLRPRRLARVDGRPEVESAGRDAAQRDALE